MKIDVPVVKSVDVLLVGGSLEGVKNALEAKPFRFLRDAVYLSWG